MKIAHVRERHAPAGAPWRLAAALDDRPAAGRRRPRTRAWIDLEVARRRAVAADRNLAHDRVLHRQPVTTLDDHLARGLRVEALAELVDGFVAARRCRRRRRRPRRGRPRVRAADPPAAEPPRLLRVRGPRPDDVGAARRRGSRGLVPPPDLLLQQRVRDPRTGRAGLVAGGVVGARLRAGGGGARRHAGASTCPPERGEEAIGGYTIFNDWSARDLQREETAVRLGPAKGKDFASSFGPWLVTPDELATARARRRHRARPRDDRRGERRRDVARALVRRAVLLRRDGRPGVGRRPAPARRPARLGDRRRAAACSRSGTRRSGDTSSPATRSSSGSTRLGALRTPIVERPR